MDGFKILAVAILCLCASMAHGGSLDELREFDIPSMPFDQAIIAFSEQADIEVLYSSDGLEGEWLTSVHGKYSARQALLLLIHRKPIMLVMDNNRYVVVAHVSMVQWLTASRD